MKRYFLFDLDNTLYLPDHGPLPQVDYLMNRFIVEKYHLTYDEAVRLRKDFCTRYGTTMEGLIRHFDSDPIEFLEYVHDVDPEHLPEEDHLLQQIMNSIPHPKYVLTNSYRKYAVRVIQALQIESYIEEIFDVVFMGLKNKTAPESYQLIMNHIDPESHPCAFIMFDDLWIYLKSAHELGLTTVLVNPELSGHPTYHLKAIHDLSELLTHLN